jgi:hypothetical protein
MPRPRIRAEMLSYFVKPILAANGTTLGYQAIKLDGEVHPLGAYFHAPARNSLADCERWAAQTAREANQAIIGHALGFHLPEEEKDVRPFDGFRPRIRVGDRVYNQGIW